MAISRAGTFEYVSIVPESGEDKPPWKVRLRTPIELTGDDRMDERLVGHSPTLEIVDAGITPGVRISPFTGMAGPRVLRSRLTLTAGKGARPHGLCSALPADQFAPSTSSFMVNYRVADLQSLLKALRAEGCHVLEKTDDSDYGKFAWVLDPEGNKVELWQPPEGQ